MLEILTLYNILIHLGNSLVVSSTQWRTLVFQILVNVKNHKSRRNAPKNLEILTKIG